MDERADRTILANAEGCLEAVRHQQRSRVAGDAGGAEDALQPAPTASVAERADARPGSRDSETACGETSTQTLTRDSHRHDSGRTRGVRDPARVDTRNWRNLRQPPPDSGGEWVNGGLSKSEYLAVERVKLEMRRSSSMCRTADSTPAAVSHSTISSKRSPSANPHSRS